MDTNHPERYRQLKEIWMRNNEVDECFKVDEISIRSHEAIVKLKDVNTVEEAAPFIRKTVLVPLEMLPKLTGKQFYLHEIKGFLLIDNVYGEVGKIEIVYDLPQHPVAGITVNNKEALLPLVPNFIETIDRENKTIYTRLPEGMIEVYTHKAEEDDE